jgi:hypothetical protein|mmetsp:Transcript_37858/g.49745  ORF Transcript_37858/g.49745 Transcript_37858/m.49745 type:complete len:104 (+) Transcript_37858:498-809(+)
MSSTYEVGRTLRILQQFPDKNSQLGALFKERLTQALLKVETLIDSDAETLCFLSSEMRPLTNIYPGQPLIRGTGDYYIGLTINQVYLYCDKDKSERQQVFAGE